MWRACKQTERHTCARFMCLASALMRNAASTLLSAGVATTASASAGSPEAVAPAAAMAPLAVSAVSENWTVTGLWEGRWRGTCAPRHAIRIRAKLRANARTLLTHAYAHMVVTAHCVTISCLRAHKVAGASTSVCAHAVTRSCSPREGALRRRSSTDTVEVCAIPWSRRSSEAFWTSV